MLDLRKLLKRLVLEKGLLYVTLGNAGASIAGALLWLFIASIMTVEDYGKLNYYLSIASLFSIVSLLGLHNVVITLVAKGNVLIKHYANLLVIISNFVILPVLLLLTRYPLVVLLFMGLSFYTMSWAEILANREYKKYAILVLAQRVAQALLAVGLYTILGIDGIIAGYAISSFIFAYNFFRSFKKFSINIQELTKIRSFIIHSYSSTLSTAITNFADKMLIAPLFGFAVLGLYQISFQFLLFLSVIPVSIFQFLLPRQQSPLEKSAIIKGFIIAASIALSSFFAIPYLISWFFPHFLESTQSAQIMILGIIPMTANAIMTSILLRKGTTVLVFISSVTYIITLSSLMFLLGKGFGLIGLAIAVLVSLIIQSSILSISLFRKSSKPNIDSI